MKITVDAREACSKKPTGKGLFAWKVIEELQRGGHEVLLLGLPREARPVLRSLGEGGRAKWGEEAKGQKPKAISFSWHLRTALKLLRERPAALYLSLTSYLVPWIVGRNFPCAIVIHDLIAFHGEPHDRKAKLIERLTLPKVLQTATHIFTVSDATKRELLERFPKTDPRKVTVVYEGPTFAPHSGASPFALRASGDKSVGKPTSPPYILSIGTLCPRKNQLRLIHAFNALPENVRKRITLILLGSRGWQDEAILELVKNSPNVEWWGYVPESERDTLLVHATVFAYPSLREGFGLPLLDALTLGIPALTSNRSSLPEVAGDAALLVDPENVEDIREGLLRLLLDETLRKTLKEQGPKQAAKFSWKRTVDLILEALAGGSRGFR